MMQQSVSSSSPTTPKKAIKKKQQQPKKTTAKKNGSSTLAFKNKTRIRDNGEWALETQTSAAADAAVAATTAPARLRRKRKFVFLMFDELDKSRMTTSIETSSDPPAAVAEFNGGKRKHRKSGRDAKRDWRLEQWIGPFKHRSMASQFQTKWNRAPRALMSRVIKGAELAFENNVDLFTFRPRELITLIATDDQKSTK